MGNGVEANGKAGKQKGKGKQKKIFLDSDAALQLAESIGGSKEDVTRDKVSKHQSASHNPKPKQSRPSEAKLKLKETKALLAAKRSQKRKDKRRQGKGQDEHKGQASPPKEPSVLKKRVSFA